MGKIVLLVPREEMLYQAHNILQEKKFRIAQMKAIRTENTVVEARRAIADGATILIARGLQASLIKQYTDIPVVEIVMTAQEMALLVVKAKQILEKTHPVIAVVGFENMFCDMSYFDELYDVELRTYFADQDTELKGVIRGALDDGTDLVIGGDTAITMATEAGKPSLFLSTTEDSLCQAFSVAESVDYAMSVEKKAAAQMETLLDYSFSGVLRLDAEGAVTATNPMIEDILGREQAALIGKNIRSLAPQIGEEALVQVFRDGEDYSVCQEWNQIPVFVVIAPVHFEGRIDGAIVTCHRMRQRQIPTPRREVDAGAKWLPVLVCFEDVLQRSSAMRECVRLAGLYAMSEHPGVLRGEPGTEKRILAECIHHASSRGSGPFLDVPCEGMSGEEQRSMIFGEQGAALQAQGGTLFLRDVEYLTAANQYRLYQLIRFRVCNGADIASLRKVDVRVMVTVRRPLASCMRDGVMTEDLYYLLSGLELSVPPLRERREDLEQKLEDSLKEACERYARYHVLTNGAKQILAEYPWPGNLFQIESFFERLVLTAGKRSIDEAAVRRLLAEMYPDAGAANEEGGDLPREDSSLMSEEEERIRAALFRCSGNREKTAAELGCSKATLWRRMKKYGIEMT
ncbi:MAG: PrpR N-terminal domain-containing protein [Clostridiales bacterium]|nr:PrpR N-terminal domain-containing protein [Clostridiales bacterium]